MSAELVPVAPQRKYRSQVPKEHRTSLDTRILWLWHQRFGTVQTVWQASMNGDVLDHTAATLILQAIMGKDLESIAQLFNRLEGGSRVDDDLAAEADKEIRV